MCLGLVLIVHADWLVGFVRARRGLEITNRLHSLESTVDWGQLSGIHLGFLHQDKKCLYGKKKCICFKLDKEIWRSYKNYYLAKFLNYTTIIVVYFTCILPKFW